MLKKNLFVTDWNQLARFVGLEIAVECYSHVGLTLDQPHAIYQTIQAMFPLTAPFPGRIYKEKVKEYILQQKEKSEDWKRLYYWMLHTYCLFPSQDSPDIYIWKLMLDLVFDTLSQGAKIPFFINDIRKDSFLEEYKKNKKEQVKSIDFIQSLEARQLSLWDLRLFAEFEMTSILNLAFIVDTIESIHSKVLLKEVFLGMSSIEMDVFYNHILKRFNDTIKAGKGALLHPKDMLPLLS